MEHNYGYQYGNLAEDNNKIDIPNFMLYNNQKSRVRPSQAVESSRQYLVEPERRRRSQYQKTGHRAHEVVRQHNHETRYAREKRRQKEIQKFVTKMATIALISMMAISSINITIDEEDSKNIEIESEAIADLPKIISNQNENTGKDTPDQIEEIEEIIHHYEVEDLDRKNLPADNFCKNLDTFLDSDQPLIGNTSEEKIWNLLYNQIGCSAEQSAAILGNMLVEDPPLNPYQHQITNNMLSKSNEEIVNSELGIGPFQFSGDRKKSFLKFIRDSESYNDLYSKFTTPKKYSALTLSELEQSNLSKYNLTNEDYDRGIKSIFAYISYEMQYPDDANYSRNQWNKTIFNDFDDEDNRLDSSDIAVQFAKSFERTPNHHDLRAAEAERVYDKYLGSITI